MSESPSRYEDLVNILPKTRYVHIESPSRHVKNADRPQRGAQQIKVFGHPQLLTRKVCYISSTTCQGVYTLTCASKRGMCTSANCQGVYTLSRAWKRGMSTSANCQGVYTRTWASKRDMCTSANRLGVYTRTLARDQGMYKCAKPAKVCIHVPGPKIEV